MIREAAFIYYIVFGYYLCDFDQVSIHKESGLGKEPIFKQSDMKLTALDGIGIILLSSHYVV